MPAVGGKLKRLDGYRRSPSAVADRYAIGRQLIIQLTVTGSPHNMTLLGRPIWSRGNSQTNWAKPRHGALIRALARNRQRNRCRARRRTARP
jgi:hypothetical protein